MNNNSIERNVDALGRVMLPKEVREVLGIKPGSTIYFEIVDDKVLFKCEAAEA
jgi:AbrB family looped-hinge helix DNA binding protein